MTSTTSVSPSHLARESPSQKSERALWMSRPVRVDGPDRMPELVYERQVAWPLEDLERLAAVDAARRAEGEALAPRVGDGARLEVLLALRKSGRLVRDRTAIHDAGAGRRVGPRAVRLQVVVGGAERLPDTGEVRLSVAHAGNRGRVVLCRDPLGRADERERKQHCGREDEGAGHCAAAWRSGLSDAPV